MRLLLDTCTFLWLANNSPEISSDATKLFRDADNEVFLSAVSTWEIAVKNALGRLPLPESPERYVPKLRHALGIQPLPLNEEASLYVGRLPALHRDPFDRMLVCQAIVHGLAILTPDRALQAYPVRTIW